jgi:hypothetical protein
LLADIGHIHPADFNGNCYNRTFAEEKVAFSLPQFSADKATASLATRVPGKMGDTTCARRYHPPHGFGSEAARQGHGDDFIVTALKTFLLTRPHLRVVSIAPHANAYNKVEGTTNSLVGHAAANSSRANPGDAA